MTFTYTPETPDDVTRVRYHIGDTDETAARLSDEEIQFAIDEAGGWKAAVIWSIDRIIALLADESGQSLDWLTIDRGDAIEAYEKLKKAKVAQLGITGPASGRIRGRAVYTRRYDDTDANWG